jgi:Mrp family chromosome partitioning ATPase
VLAGDKRDYRGKLLTSSTPFGVTEAFNTLRTNLCYSTAAEKCPVFAVTSDFSGAGKSVISANVAISLAMLGKKIVGDGDVTYNAMTFVDGRPTGEGESKTVANLRFA